MSQAFNPKIPGATNYFNRRGKKIMNGWSDLPQELLAVICAGVEDLNDNRQLRSVCRSWRSFLPLPPNRLSPLFPQRISASSPPFTALENRHRPIDLISKSVYLLRPRGDPSIAWLVSMEEANAGVLRLRHPITYDTLDISPSNLSDLLSGWSATEIVRSHSFCFADGTRQVLRFDDWCGAPLPSEIRRPGTKLATTGKVVLVSSNPRPDRICDFTAVVLHARTTRLSAFRLSDESGSSQVLHDVPTKTDDIHHIYSPWNYIDDIVNFNGRVCALDYKGRVFIVDHQTLRLSRIDDSHYGLPEEVVYGRKRLVESKGELYMVSKFYKDYGMHPPTTCIIYKLAMNDAVRRLYKWEKVEDLGDQVFFIAVDCSYSMPAAHLPFPWRGNCVVFDKEGLCPSSLSLSTPIDKEIEVFHLGGAQQGQLRPFSFYPGFCDLFNPFSSGIRKWSCPNKRKWPCPNRWRTDEVAGTPSSATGMELRPNKKFRVQAL